MSRKPAPLADGDEGIIPHVFMSYARVNDLDNWVGKLRMEVKRRLAVNLGAECVAIWFDKREIRGNTEFPDVLKDKVTAAEAFLMVHAKGYHMSPWCRGEMALFRSQPKEPSAFFLIEYRNDRRPRGLEKIPGYRFWVEDPESGIPLTLNMDETNSDRDKELFGKRCALLCYDLANYLEKRIDALKMRTDALSQTLAQSLEQWKEEKGLLQTRHTPLDLMKFVNLLQFAVSEGMKTKQPPDFTSVLEKYSLLERDTYFDALVDLILARSRGRESATSADSREASAGPPDHT